MHCVQCFKEIAAEMDPYCSPACRESFLRRRESTDRLVRPDPDPVLQGLIQAAAMIVSRVLEFGEIEQEASVARAAARFLEARFRAGTPATPEEVEGRFAARSGMASVLRACSPSNGADVMSASIELGEPQDPAKIVQPGVRFFCARCGVDRTRNGPCPSCGLEGSVMMTGEAEAIPHEGWDHASAIFSQKEGDPKRKVDEPCPAPELVTNPEGGEAPNPTTVCPHCGKRFARTNTRCPHCGAKA